MAYWTGGFRVWFGGGSASEVGETTGVTGLTGAAAGLAGGRGMYSGPVWPQPPRTIASAVGIAVVIRRAVGDFTIRITV
ncbi:hypothetical protein C2862_09870 [Massilia sp. Mn16-1_5]|nr:hypothetical protein C2862_09870 [Massilia sp. Mn16-1_5]